MMIITDRWKYTVLHATDCYNQRQLQIFSWHIYIYSKEMFIYFSFMHYTNEKYINICVMHKWETQSWLIVITAMLSTLFISHNIHCFPFSKVFKFSTSVIIFLFQLKEKLYFLIVNFVACYKVGLPDPKPDEWNINNENDVNK